MRALSTISLLPLLALTACGAGSSDGDSDFLSDEFEALIGTRDDLRDTDGDGFTDAEEHLTYFDANELDDVPYEGSYPRLALPESIDDEGWNEGDVSGDWTRTDQHDRDISLHDFYGNVIVVAVLAEYVDTAQDDAVDHQDAYDDYRDRGFMVIHILVDGEPEDTAPDPAGWASDFGLDFAVVDDTSQTLIDAYVDTSGPKFTIPSYTVIGRDMVVREHDNTDRFSTDLIEDLLDEPVPAVDWPLPANTAELREALELRHYTDDDAVLGAKLVDASMDASLDGDLANSLQEGRFAPVDSDGNAAALPFGGTSCSAVFGPALFPLLLLSPLRRRR